MQLNFGLLLVTAIALVLGVAVLWWLLSKLYQRSTTDLSFVRTGFMGERVVISGGALVVPVLHEVAWVNMNTMRISLSHHNENALITQDRLRVNVDADFYVRVQPEPAAVSAAARALGSRSTSSDGMRLLLEARFNDALRTAAALEPMEALHENRGALAARVRGLASQGIAASGLEIDSVSFSRLDQTSREFFNPNNAFDAAGLTKLTAEIEERRKRRNEIERDAQVAIQRKNLATEQVMLQLRKEEEHARLTQEREIAVYRTQQQSQLTIESADLRRGSELAEVAASEAIAKARLVSDRSLREEKLQVEQQIKEAEISRTRAVELAETERRQSLEIAQQASEIEIAKHSTRRNTALAEADNSRAVAVKAAESVNTARELARAERDKALALMQAERDTEVKGLAVVRQARAEHDAAEQQAKALRLMEAARSEAERQRIQDAGLRYDIEAQGRRALNEAENLASPDAMDLRARLAAIGSIEGVVRESAKPLERLSEIKIVHLDGLSSGSGPTEGGASSPSISDQVMNSALKYKLQAPMVDALMKSVGLKDNASITEMLASEA
jgi:uncharacterized membrane protein YqiK